MSTSPSASVEIKNSESDSDHSSPIQSLPPAASTRSKSRRLQPATPPQLPSARTRQKSWMVNSTKMNLRSSHGKAYAPQPIVNAPSSSPKDAEVVEPVVESGPTHSPTNANHTKARTASTVHIQQHRILHIEKKELTVPLYHRYPSRLLPLLSVCNVSPRLVVMPRCAETNSNSSTRTFFVAWTLLLLTADIWLNRQLLSPR